MRYKFKRLLTMKTHKNSNGLLLNILLCISLFFSNLLMSQQTFAIEETTQLFSYSQWFDPTSNSEDGSEAYLDAKRDNGAPWVFYYYIAALENGGGDTRFEAMPQGIFVNAADVHIAFNSKSMAKGEPKKFSVFQTLLSQQLPDAHVLIESPDLSRFAPEQLRSQSLLKFYNYGELLRAPSSIGINLTHTENLTPVALYAIAGQGPVPEEIQQFIDQTRGSWFQRYRHIIYSVLIAMAALYGFYRYATR